MWITLARIVWLDLNAYQSRLINHPPALPYIALWCGESNLVAHTLISLN